MKLFSFSCFKKISTLWGFRGNKILSIVELHENRKESRKLENPVCIRIGLKYFHEKRSSTFSAYGAVFFYSDFDFYDVAEFPKC